MNRAAIICMTIAGLSLLGFGAILGAGPLNPPAGPVASTYKTLSEVEPRIAINAANTPGDADSLFRIAKRGSYYLTDNITGVVGKASVIEIGVSDVAIDMNGFTIDGLGLGTTGIRVEDAAMPDRISIRNGVVRRCVTGISLVHGQVGGTNAIVERVSATDNTTGFFLGFGYIVRSCHAANNTSNGFSTQGSGIIQSCVATGNGGVGISASGRLTGCYAAANGQQGIQASGTVSECHTVGNDSGGARFSYAVVESCRFEDGAEVQTGCIVRGNGCFRPGNTAMLVSGTDNRIEGNTFTNSTFGLSIIAPGNIVIRNTSGGNSINWSIVAGNALAPVVQALTNASTFNGNVYTGNLGSTDPNANFTY
jgi:hypothetical protein